VENGRATTWHGLQLSPGGDEVTSVAGHPARPEVAAQIYNQALHTVMISKFTQGGQKLDDVIKWTSNELEGYLRQ
jgi:hypothetical protein